ncbi:MAG: His/Gly/Thr/Pro-type tRNA ligase C-terminal domain-containing protein, partial [Bacilli bacterium]|nr:His/Gly/Thr/Pro-type tRNA ligase C-terminal domain-containing protein [Bacilli bacterium]
WLAPTQVNIVPVNNNYHLDYSKKLEKLFSEANFRVELDAREEKLSYKIRESQTNKVPITIIIGDKEVDAKNLTYRVYGSEESISIPVDEFIKKVNENIQNKKVNNI